MNNIYVNSANFGFDPFAFLHARRSTTPATSTSPGITSRRMAWLVDMHGAAVIDPVWALLVVAYERIGRPVPTCLERDFNIPDLAALSAGRPHRPPAGPGCRA